MRIAERRKRREHGDLLWLHASAFRSDAKDLNKTINKARAD